MRTPTAAAALTLCVCVFASLAPEVNAQALPNALTVTSANSSVYQANQTITTSGPVTVNSGSSVAFQAGITIKLEPGFHAASGSAFHAFMAAPDYVVSVTPAAGNPGTVLAGIAASYNVTVTGIFNFAGTVYFSPAGVTGLPQGVSPTFSASSISPPVNGTSNPITLTIPTVAGKAGNYVFTVVGSSLGYPSHLGTNSLSIQDFYLTLSPSSITASSGATVTYQVTATGINGFNGSISLGFNWMPTGPATPSWSPLTIQPGTTATFTMRVQSAPQTWYGFQISGSVGAVTRYVTGALGVSSSSGSMAASCSATPNLVAAGQSVMFAANPSGGTAPYTYTWSGVLAGTGQNISFTPTAVGSFVENLSVTDRNGYNAVTSCTLTVQQGGTALTITTSSTLPYGTAGAAYSISLAATGGTGAYTWSVASPLPTGLGVSSAGVLGGIPTTAGSYTFYIRVADTGGHSVTSEFAMTVSSGGAQSGVQVSLGFPQLSGGYPGSIHQFTFHFTDPLGPSDISGGQIAFNIDISGPDLPVCQLDWYVNGNVDINGIAYGNFGVGSSISSTYCTVYTAESTLLQTSQGYDVSVLISFPEPLPKSLLPAWTRGITRAGVASSWTPAGARSLGPRLVAPDDNVDYEDTAYCGGGPVVSLDGFLTRYSDGTISGGIGERMLDLGYWKGWQNYVSNGEIYSSSDSINPLATNPTSAGPSTDFGEVVLQVPAQPPYPTGPGGKYYTQGDYKLINENCWIIVAPGFPGSPMGHEVNVYGFKNEFDLSGASVDPTPIIDGVSLTPELVSGNSAALTIFGRDLGASVGTLQFSSSEITYDSVVWGPGLITATVHASANAVGDYTVQVVSGGGASGNGFQRGGSPNAPQSTPNSNQAHFQVQMPTIKGQVTLGRDNSVLQGVSISVTDSNNSSNIYCFGLKTDSNGRYECAIPAGGTYIVMPSFPFTYWFTPTKSPNIGAGQTQNFTGAYLLTVYLLHGIGQNNSAMQNLAVNLQNPTTGLDATRFRIDPNFNFGECAQVPCSTSQYGDACGVAAGGKSLAHYLQLNPPAGDVIFVGYSMGGLIARDLMAYNYFNVLTTQHRVAGLITLGSPHLGYPWAQIDESSGLFCTSLLEDMKGSWMPQEPPPNELLSTYLSGLASKWQSASYFASWQPVVYGRYWVAAAGESCSNPVRDKIGILPPLQPGCLTNSPSVYSDGVVCHDSAVYSSSIVSGPAPTKLFEDPGRQYVHTNAANGFGTIVLLCPNSSTSDPIPLFNPRANDSLFTQYIVGTINGTNYGN